MQSYSECNDMLERCVQGYRPMATLVQECGVQLEMLEHSFQEEQKRLGKLMNYRQQLSDNSKKDEAQQRDIVASQIQQTQNKLYQIQEAQGKLHINLQKIYGMIERRIEQCRMLHQTASQGAATSSVAAGTMGKVSGIRLGQSAAGAASMAQRRSSDYTRMARLAARQGQAYAVLLERVESIGQAEKKRAVVQQGHLFCMQLEAEERQAIEEYTMSDWYKNINNTLRHPLTTHFISGNRERARLIHKGLSKSALPCECMVYRGTSKKFLGKYQNAPDEALVGKVLPERGFMSTSLNKEDHFGGEVILHIKAPKGASGAYIGSISNKKDSESEVLFDCGQMLRINRVRRDAGGRRILDAEIMM